MPADPAGLPTTENALAEAAATAREWASVLERGSPGWLMFVGKYPEQLRAFADALDAALSLVHGEQQDDAGADDWRREKGEAEALLGEIGAGGTPAGLVPAIHNLIGMYEKAQAAALAAVSVTGQEPA